MTTGARLFILGSGLGENEFSVSLSPQHFRLNDIHQLPLHAAEIKMWASLGLGSTNSTHSGNWNIQLAGGRYAWSLG
jgi:hypothetical protein